MIDVLNKHFQNSLHVSTQSALVQFIFALGIQGLGPQTKKASAFIVMAIVGGAIMPMLMGWLADVASMRVAFVVPLFCFAGIAAYGGSWKRLVANGNGYSTQRRGGHRAG